MGKNNNDAQDEEMSVTLELDDGSSVECAIITILTVGEQDYIVLLPLDENGENEDGEVWFYRYSENENDPNEEPELEYIEDDEEYEAVAEAFDEYLDSVEFDEIIDAEEEQDYSTFRGKFKLPSFFLYITYYICFCSSLINTEGLFPELDTQDKVKLSFALVIAT